MATTYRFIEPLDVLFLRGNKLFGDAGSHGESLVPPWPSVAAGALRSLMLASDGIDPAAFAAGSHAHPTLGTPSAPGTFVLAAFDLARRLHSGAVETLHAMPADLVLTEVDAGSRGLVRMTPHDPADGLASSAPLERWPVLPQGSRIKPVGGHWLTQAGWAGYLEGQTPSVSQLVAGSDLWRFDARVGIGLDEGTRSVATGKLFTAQAVAFVSDRWQVGFVVAVRGAEPPTSGMLRFGGDGRGAAMTTVPHTPPQPDWDSIARARRCRIVLTSPGLFAAGWLPPGMDSEQMLSLHGITGRQVCAAVPRAEVVSGWDLARAQPKAAERVAPTGSVYWIDDLDATAQQLRELSERGLWNEENHNPARLAEGFNRFTFAAY